MSDGPVNLLINAQVGSPFHVVRLRCRATVGDEVVEVNQYVASVVLEDPVARDLVERQLRFDLVNGILQKWKPKIEILG